jgi:type VI secretion system protein ImpH
VSLAFPASDVAEVKRREAKNGALRGVGAEARADASAQQRPPFPPKGPARMTVNFMGLAGASGPLPGPLTELVIERTRNGDKAARDFLDIFNHRLVSLLYRIRKLHRVGLDTRPPGEDRVASYLYSVVGLGTPHLDGRMQVENRSLLHYAGLLGQRQRSMAGLERIVADYFGVGVRGTQFAGRWRALEEGQWTRLGEREGRNQRLGEDAVVGTRVWDQQGAFELNLGPLTLAQFQDFLPTGWGFRPLCDLVRFYVGDDLDFSFRLTLKAGEAKGTRLAGAQLGSTSRLGEVRLSDAAGARLGWTSWLNSWPDAGGTRPGWTWWRGGDDSRVVVSPDSLRAFGAPAIVPYLAPPPDILAELRRVMKVLKFAAGVPVIEQGKRGDTVFVIRRGSVKITRRHEDGREIQLGTRGPGEYFGEMALLTGKVRRATVVTLEECELLELRKQELDYFMAKYPRFGAQLRDAQAQLRKRKMK